MKKKRMFKCKSLKENNYKNWSWAFIIGREYELRDESVNCYLFNLTDPKKEYLFHADKECFEEVKNIIGYKLVKREYRKPVAIIISSDSRELNSMDGFYFENNSISKDRLEKAGVLDLWCEIVYEKEIKSSDNKLSDNKILDKKDMQGKQYKHTNGNIYTILFLTNINFTKDHPIDVVYIGQNGKIWSRRLTDWHRSFTKC